MSSLPTLPLKDSYTEEEQAAANAALADSFITPGVESALKVDINEFTAKTKEITALFDEVHEELKAVDKLNLNPPLAPTWKTYSLKFRKLLWASRDLATRISTSCEMFHTAIIPLAAEVHQSASSQQAKEKIQEVMDSIDEYISTNTSNTTDAKAQADEFQALGADVRGFGEDFKKFGQDLEDKNKKRIEELKAKIQRCTEEIKALKGELVKAAEKLKAAQISLAVLTFVPLFGLIGMGAALIAVGILQNAYNKVRDAIDDKEKELAAAQKEKKELEDQNALILKTRAQLQRLADTKLTQIVTGLESFEIIWNSVNTDCVRVKKYMEDAKKGWNTAKIPLLVVIYMKNANSVYIGLSKALTAYAIGIDNSGIARPE